MSIEQEILTQYKTLAVVGLSSNPERTSHRVAGYLQQQGYKIIPVNPNESRVLGETCYASLTDIPDPVEVVVIFRKSEDVPPVVEEAIQVGVKAVWMQEGIINEEAAAQAGKAGIRVVMDRCTLKEHQRLKK